MTHKNIHSHANYVNTRASIELTRGSNILTNIRNSPAPNPCFHRSSVQFSSSLKNGGW